MERSDVLKFVSPAGYKTYEEISEEFENQNQEILDMILESLVETNGLRKASYKTLNGKGRIYYIPATD